MWIHFLSFSFSYRFCFSAPGWLGVQSDRAEEAAGGREEAEAERRPCRHRPGGHGNHIRILLGDWSLCVCSLRCRLLMMLYHHFQPTTWNLAHLKKLARKSTLPLKSEFYRLSVAGTANYLPVYPSLALRSDNFQTREDMIYLVSSSTSQQSQLCRRVTSCPRPRTGPGNSSQGRPELAGFWWVSLLPLTIT